MLVHLFSSSPLDAALWLFLGACQFLSALAFYRGQLRRHRAFALYLHFAFASTLILMCLPAGNNAGLSYPSALVQMGLLTAVVVELYQNTIGPKEVLPQIVIRNIAASLAGTAAVSLLLSLLCLPRFGDRVLRVLAAAENFTVLGLALAIWILIIQARRLHHDWRPRDAQIAGGCVLMLSFGAVAIMVMFTQPAAQGWAAFRISELANILAFGWWTFSLLQREAPIPAPTDEQLALAIQSNTESCRRLSAIEAALGQVVE